jgi:hypothetical protein
METNDIECPKFAWMIMIGLGCVDLVRGFVHTVLLEYAAINIFVIDTSGGVDNQMFLLGLFGITNYLTGIMFILVGLKARQLVPIMLPIIPIAYFGGSALISRVATPTAELGGLSFMNAYILFCIATSLAIFAIEIRKRMNND